MFNFQFYHSERSLKCSRAGSVGGHCLLKVLNVPVYGHNLQIAG